MADSSHPLPAITPPKQINRHIFAAFAVLSLAAAVGLWFWFNQTIEETLKLGAGMELRTRTASPISSAPRPPPGT